MRVAVVWNNNLAGVINRFGQPYPTPPGPWPEGGYSGTIGRIATALQERGHDTLLCEGDKGLLTTLEQYMPPDLHHRPSGIVFNLAEGIQGDYRFIHVPAMLEMAGVPYTGSSPLAQGLQDDKVVSKTLIRDCGVPTPNYRVMRLGTESSGDLRFPVVVKPRHEDNSFGLHLVNEPAQLRQAVEEIVATYRQDALVEEYIDGREIAVGLLGNDNDVEVLPLLEKDFGDREPRIMTWEAKYTASGVKKVCPAQIEGSLAGVLRDISVATFRACLCRDYARVDLRIDRSGRPFVLEINSMPGLSMNSSYVEAAKSAGYSFSGLINRILDIAHRRYFGMDSH
ncbi:MAG: ATP-grasp domain-containing protein [Mesorhizobium sp.]|uniref:D-alanine--D-alanine ligase family protein n=1 Tax=unclassified Mesorhizobium TaxID=325217 RepID=UPI000F763D68|nr:MULTISPECIES: ATP-grasp domain-containing protein [unclassified Mesorhizobium]RUX08735.1 ATP-grasp domain-containing protein [Mesorhizobium sp. M8A.F.Ca.ET.059.01.1.1]AZO52373.1 ATP-grasp domain-containing protein [Mesorhizobium sp. M8A.F.Ca.ET.057.01.1.1]RWE31566.1 MAG: ATP-grasp domain-containing protein [Mesorhizobium sp.]RWE43950.1 MAG: ATP-grasp domain-containing protein [Mesorhizobium sp.]TIW26478.1 MAG: ATP-grasp domain-containing protein [Mesorhizobium sp.]